MCRVRTVGSWRTPWSAGVGPRSGCVVHESVGVGHAGAGRGHRRWFVSRADLPAWWPAAVPFRGSCQPGGRPVFVYDVSRPGIGPGQRHGRRPPHPTYATRSKRNIPCTAGDTRRRPGAGVRVRCIPAPAPVSAQASGMAAARSTRRIRRAPRGTPRAPRTTPRRPGCLVPLGSSRPGVPPAATGRAPRHRRQPVIGHPVPPPRVDLKPLHPPDRQPPYSVREPRSRPTPALGVGGARCRCRVR